MNQPTSLPQPDSPRDKPQQSWSQKFTVAIRGLRIAISTETCFYVHLAATVAVLLAGWALDISKLEWCLLALCIGIVLSAELMNTALERLAQAITKDDNSHIRDALDIASSAVLTAALTAATLGAMIFGRYCF